MQGFDEGAAAVSVSTVFWDIMGTVADLVVVIVLCGFFLCLKKLKKNKNLEIA